MNHTDYTDDDLDDVVTELTPEQCWALLEGEEFGRLAFRLVSEVHIVPINYSVEHRVLLFPTTSGNKLLAAAMHSEVAFEIDWYDDQSAWSVVVRGTLRRLGEDETRLLGANSPKSWLPTLKRDVVELSPSAVTGRRFVLRRPATS
ncbi:pyridoxamine 5'-phosphate oxidase family protein [Nocardioides jensenii]|uniref:pyridoxamine 5'-phosphate oxidase family protein n=1 Tax=Nocardioides jensenii TaxID=1843 RepID=UPI00082C52AE|nr:pyridoxamine 5'-phosphate oxidase family protein [Nocardioides jensenii]